MCVDQAALDNKGGKGLDDTTPLLLLLLRS